MRATLPILPYDERAAEWHGEERARLKRSGRIAPFADGQIAPARSTWSGSRRPVALARLRAGADPIAAGEPTEPDPWIPATIASRARAFSPRAPNRGDGSGGTVPCSDALSTIPDTRLSLRPASVVSS